MFDQPKFHYLHHCWTKNPSSITKLFADDTSIFSFVKEIKLLTDQLNSGLCKISKWAYQWKMSFNPNLKKQAQDPRKVLKQLIHLYSSTYFQYNMYLAKSNYVSLLHLMCAIAHARASTCATGLMRVKKVKNKKHHQIGGRKFYWVGSHTLNIVRCLPSR